MFRFCFFLFISFKDKHRQPYDRNTHFDFSSFVFIETRVCRRLNVRVILIVMHGWYFRCMRYRFVNGFVWVCAYDWTCVSFRWISHFYFFHLDSLQGQRILRRETVTNMLWWTIHSMVRRKQQQQQKGLSKYLVCNESDKLLKIFSPITELRASDW